MAETSPSSSLDSLLGRLVVERGLATADEVHQVLEQQRKSLGESDVERLSSQSLADMLVDAGLVTRSQVERIRPDIEDRRQTHQIPGYQMLERLGAGAMATVHKAKQLSLDRMVAIKILPRKFTEKPQFVERFYAEGRAAARLNHPNIVGAIEVGVAGKTHYFVMEYVEGRTVFDDITNLGRYKEGRALDIILQITRALAHAHEKGLIHRDVKPKNIMITTDGVAKLADMGLARAVTDLEAAEAEAGKAFGTPYYISPEQIRGEVDIDFRADIYSLGCTLYHMVTGRVPYDGPNPSAVMQMHLKSAPKPVDHINPQLSAGLAEIIEVAMAKDPAKRYANTADLLTDLEAVHRGEPPLQARKMFDLASLASLQDSGDTQQLQSIDISNAHALTNNPLLLLAIAGWSVTVLLIITIVIMTFRA